MDDTLNAYFVELDRHLSDLGKSDSSVEYASHIRDEFNKVVSSVNKIRLYIGGDSVKFDSYFE